MISKELKSQYVVSDTIWEEQDKLIDILYWESSMKQVILIAAY